MEAMTPPDTQDKESEVLFKFTFELRKKVPDLIGILSCFSKLQHNASFELSFGLAADNNRIFFIKSFESNANHPTLQFNRKLRSVTTEVKMAITKLNFAIAHDATILFKADDDETHFIVSVIAPKNKRRRDTIIENFKLI